MHYKVANGKEKLMATTTSPGMTEEEPSATTTSEVNHSNDEDFAVPIPIQTFLWRQTCPFIRPRLGRLHEATCVFCQSPGVHHEIREATKSLEKVLVQNIQFGLSPSLSQALKSIPRWRVIQTAFPHVMHCTAQLLMNRKQSGIQGGLGAAETKLLYTLHWILLDSAEECADADFEKGLRPQNSFHYLFPITAITLFVYLFAPLCSQLRVTDFNNFRLENGFRVWPSMWGHKVPDKVVCFNCPVKPTNPLSPFFIRKQKKDPFENVFGDNTSKTGGGGKMSTPPPTPEHAKTEFSTNLVLEEELEKLASPSGQTALSSSGGTVPFPETIPEESSSNDEEHVMIFRLGSIPESDGLREGSVFKMSVPMRRQPSCESSKTCPSPSSDKAKDRKGSNESAGRPRMDSSPRPSIGKSDGTPQAYSSTPGGGGGGKDSTLLWKNLRLASFMDVAVLRCLFVPQWEEEGVYWGCMYLFKRFEEIAAHKAACAEEEVATRQRSNSLPTPKCQKSYLAELALAVTTTRLENEKTASAKPKLKPEGSIRGKRGSHGQTSPFFSYSACSSPVAQRRSNDSRRGSERGSKKKISMLDLKSFVESKILSKSEKNLEKMEDLDNEMDPFVRPKSAMGHRDEDESNVKDNLDDKYFGEQSNLFKGKSMPSLSSLHSIELAAPTGYCGMTRLQPYPLKTDKIPVPNPIITVTEHTPAPTPSPDRMYRRRASSLESQLNSFIHQFALGSRRGSGRHLIRSHSDTNIQYTVCESTEAPGTAQYIRSDGTINVKVVFQAVHLICARETIHRSVRVCQVVLNLIDHLYLDIEKDKEIMSVLETVTRVISAMGCAQGCADSQRCTQSDAVRSQAQNLLLRLCQKFNVLFSKFFQNFVIQQNLTTVMEFFHALCGFCMDSTSLLSPMAMPNPKIRDFYTGYNNGMENNQQKVECQIFKFIFKRLVTRMASVHHLRATENMALYCDIRQFINYVYENDGNTFRRVALSALLDSVDRPNKKNARQSQTTRVVRRMTNTEDSPGYYIMDETTGPQSSSSNKKGFFKKKSSSSTCASMGDTDNTGESPSGTLSRKHATLTPKSSEIDLVAKRGAPSKKESRLVSWLMRGSTQERSLDLDGEDSNVSSGTGASEPKRTMRQATIVQKAKRRVEERLRRMKIKRDSTNEDSLAGGSRKGSLENVTSENVIGETSEFVVLKERRLVSKDVVKAGIRRFGFLLEITHPGSLPDAGLMAALLDLPKTVVVARSCMLLECSYLVHACNRGHWPLWMKFPIFRPSCAGLPAKPVASKSKSYALQRMSGKMFHQWGEAINARLEEYNKKNRQKLMELDLSDEAKQKELAQNDEEEDFLDDASIMDGAECPLALQVLSCMLLYEITAFIRETYQTLPKASVVHKPPPPPVKKEEEVAPKPVVVSGNANRRWSYVRKKLLGLGQAQTQGSHSLQSISDQPPPPAGSGERKISFVLNDEPSTESGEKSHGAHPELPEPSQKAMSASDARKVRPLLLRRGAPSTTTATGGSSFRRRSIKLNKKAKDGDSDSMKRSDSMTSARRKVSSVSDETSEHSGDESPGVMSNEDAQAGGGTAVTQDEECLSMPWISTIIEFLSSLNFRCTHQGFCHPHCPRRLMRGVSRLLKAVRKVYGEEFGFPNANSWGLNHQDEGKDGAKEKVDDPSILKYVKQQVQGGFHSLFSILIKAGSMLNEEQFLSILPITWELILEPEVQVSTCASALFILAGVKVPEQVRLLLEGDFEHANPNTRISALLKFHMLWKCRHHVWPRMEENSTFKAPPPGIEFTLPSPRIGVESIAVVDPPWMPEIRAKVEEVTLTDQQVSRRYLVTATKTRKTQQAELVRLALKTEEDKKRTEREQFLITTVAITKEASYEPSLHHVVGEDEEEEGQVLGQGEKATLGATSSIPPNLSSGATAAGTDGVTLPASSSSKASHLKSPTMFPSSLGSAAIHIAQLLDDPAVTLDGNAVYEVAYATLWDCLVEDSSLFLRFVFEKLTRGRHELMFKVLRHIILFVPRLPQQAAFALYNHIIGFIMYHTRSPQDASPEMIGSALSVLWMVVHSVQGIMFKDLKQILRKEQCDAFILLTANIPAAKKIVVHGPMGPEAGGIPTQFPIQEDTQFVQILRESYDFFSIDEEHHKEYFLVDFKTHQIHNPNSYVRDFYFFSRAQHPQLSLVHMAPDHAYNALQRQSFILKFLEIGKVTLTWAILKNVDQVMQRVVFLHEELMKLPAFPRKALESDMDIWKGGMMGRELLGLDVLHKFMWAKLITRMFEAMSGNFAYSGDIHLFINVLSGSLMVHSEDHSIIRYIISAMINGVQQFKNIFSTNGYLLVMPPLLLLYSTHQSNALVTGAVEFACKEFYLLHRKPFVLQMFGALAALLDTDDTAQFGDPTRVPSKCLFRLLLSLETPTPDPLHITELIHGPQPLRPLDFCYHDDSDEITVLDCISMCVCVVAYAADSLRGQQMLTILEAVVPPYLTHIQTNKTEGKTERDIINHIAVAMKTLVNNCEPLAKNYSGPQMASPTDLRGSSQRNYTSKGGQNLLTPGYEFGDDDSHSKYMSDHSRTKNVYDRDMQDSEVIRDEFRRPRDTLLCLVSDFYSKCSTRLPELAKKGGNEAKPVELLDIKSHVRLSEVCMSLLKVSPYDPATMGCRGLQKYMVEVFPYGEWTHESSRAALSAFLRRLDKTFIKICKKTSIRRHTDWEAAAGLLKGIYQMLWRHPYIVHNQHLKSLISTCQCLLMGEGQASELQISSAGAALLGKLPPAHFCSTVVRLLALQVRALGEPYSLEQSCGFQFAVSGIVEKSETLLMHLLLPMCIRVGTGRKDVPRMRKSDIIFILNVILNCISPGSPRIKSTTEANTSIIGIGGGGGSGATRSGSVTERKVRMSTFQIGFLGLKILCVCFDTELGTEWARTVRIIHELGNKGEGGGPLWEFLEFVITVRTSIYPMFRPFIAQKLAKPPANDQDRHFQFTIREKLREVTLGKCKGVLLQDLAHQMKQLKEDLENRKEETVISKKNLNPEANEQGRRARPSLSELFPGLAARFGGGGDDSSKGSSGNIHKSSINRESSVRVKPTSQGRMVDRYMRRVSIAGTSDAPFTIPENSILKAKERSEETFELHTEGPSEGTGTTEEEPKSHRLQRQKFQSRKTFRFRKSRKGAREFSSVDMEEESVHPESPSPVSSPREELLKKDDKGDTEDDKSSPESCSKPQSSLRLRTKRKTSTSQNGGDCESQTSQFSRTSSSVGYRESFAGSAERYSLQMLENLDITPTEEKQSPPSHKESKSRQGRKKEDDEDTLI
ncbi:protein unc-80 homolog isoform X4 [Folsomia candida]|uniref:protein unc-80 homolog isoform X4 n=1 Tax=Folsomia candida TaxID=158441 RepID=UPI0016054F2B|nr:protein unc-80 homolog isoform X4 [Folsomia candida]